MDSRQAIYQDALDGLAVEATGEIDAGGFPSYFSFAQNSATIDAGNLKAQFGAFRAYLPLRYDGRILFRTDDPIALQIEDQSFDLRAAPTRIEVEFADDQSLRSTVIDARAVKITHDGQIGQWDRMILAHDETQSPAWAMRLSQEAREDIVFGADDLGALLQMLGADYLQ